MQTRDVNRSSHTGMLESIAALAQSRNKGNNYVAYSAQSERYTVLDQRNPAMSAGLIGAIVLNELRGELRKPAELNNIARGLDVIAERSEEKNSRRWMVCRVFSEICQSHTNAAAYRDIPHVPVSFATNSHALFQAAAVVREVANRMKTVNDKNFVIFMTALTQQHQELRALTTHDRAVFCYLASGSQVKAVREKLEQKTHADLLANVEELDLSDSPVKFTKEIVKILEGMSGLKTLKVKEGAIPASVMKLEHLQNLESKGILQVVS